MQLISDETLQAIEQELGLDLLDEGQRSIMMTDIISLISSRAGLRIIREFDAQTTGEFNSIPDNEPEKMEEFILIHNPQAREIFEEEAGKVKQEILGAKLA